MIERGAIHWAVLGPPLGSRPAKRRPVVVVQSDSYNRSELGTVIVAVITSTTRLASRPGNVFLPASASGLPRDSVVNVTALVTVDRRELEARIGTVPSAMMREVDQGLRRVLGI